MGADASKSSQKIGKVDETSQNEKPLNDKNKEIPTGTPPKVKFLSASMPYTQTQNLSCDVGADFKERDEWVYKVLSLLTSEGHDSWGPKAPVCPSVIVPEGVDQVQWKRTRVINVAKKYIGLPYKHHHVPEWFGPAGQGTDCSNLTAWAYNYGLGIKFTSKVGWQAEGPRAPGRKLEENEKLEPGDLLFIMNKERSFISHVVLYISPEQIIDTRGKGGCQIRPFKGWYKSHYVFGRRIIE